MTEILEDLKPNLTASIETLIESKTQTTQIMSEAEPSDLTLILPEESLLHVFSFVSKEAYNTIRMVCKRWNNLSKDKILYGRRLHVNVALVGPSGIGKTTLMAQVLLKTGEITQRTFEKNEKLQTEAGKKWLKFSSLIDVQKDEKEKEKSVVLHRKRISCKYQYVVLIDTPGFQSYIKSKICGIAQSDSAILVVPSTMKKLLEVESEISTEIRLCKVSGIKELIVVVNKMDETPTAYSKEEFELVKTAISNKLKFCGIKTTDVPFIPMDAFGGENISAKSEKMPWYNGPTLLEVLETLDMPNRELHKPLRIMVDHTCAVSGIGTVAVGTVIQGVLFPGQKVLIGPGEITTEVKTIQLAIPKVPVDMGFPGDTVGVALKNVSKKDMQGRRIGAVIGAWDEKEQAEAAKVTVQNGKVVMTPAEKLAAIKRKKKHASLFAATSFTAKLYVWDPKGKITLGYQPSIHVHNAMGPVKIKSIKEEISLVPKQEEQDEGWKRPTSEKSEEAKEIKEIKKGQVMMVEFTPAKKLAIDTVEKCPKLGRFVLREGYSIIGGGVVVDVKFD